MLVSVWPEQVNKPHLLNTTNCWACRGSYSWPNRTWSYKCLDNKKPPPGIAPSDIDEPSKCVHFILYQPLRKIYNSWKITPFCIMLFFMNSLSVAMTCYTHEKSCMMCYSTNWTMEIWILALSICLWTQQCLKELCHEIQPN